jgi:hypothetical protein
LVWRRRQIKQAELAPACPATPSAPLNQEITTMLRHLLAATALVATPALLTAAGTHPIYGIHFYGTGAENTIRNGKQMYSLEMLYTTEWDSKNKPAERAKIQDIRSKGFTIILRLDYSHSATVPTVNDWTGRYYYAVKAGEIAAYMGDLVDIYVVGNEMTTSPNPGCRDALWYAKVYNGHDTNCVYDRIKAADAGSTILLGALTGWPDFNNLIGGRNVDWIRTVQNNVDQSGGKPVIDGYALHTYSGNEYYNDSNSPCEDPRYSDITGFNAFIHYLRPIYEKHGPNTKVFITETNTYWMSANKESDLTYRDNWMKEAFQTVDEWNKRSDLKIDGLLWYTYSHFNDPGNRDIWGNAIMRTDNARLNRARQDFSWVTANTNMTPGFPGGVLRFEAENYTNSAEWILDNGVQNVDYFDKTPTNQGGLYRNGLHTQNRPDIAWNDTYTGFVIGWMEPGEWLRYETIAGGRNYTPRVRYARGATGNGSFRIDVDGTTVATISVPSTGGWNTYTTRDGAPFYMAPGYHTIRVTAVSGGTNLDWFEFR